MVITFFLLEAVNVSKGFPSKFTVSELVTSPLAPAVILLMEILLPFDANYYLRYYLLLIKLLLKYSLLSLMQACWIRSKVLSGIKKMLTLPSPSLSLILNMQRCWTAQLPRLKAATLFL